MGSAAQAINFAAGVLAPVFRDRRVRSLDELRELLRALAGLLYQFSSSSAAVLLEDVRLS